MRSMTDVGYHYWEPATSVNKAYKMHWEGPGPASQPGTARAQCNLIPQH